MKKLFILILLVPSLILGQTKDELDLCMAIQGNSFSTDTAAENALKRILNTIGASKNFVLTPCDNINNAIATAYKGKRYILYDRKFMDLISKNTNDWSNLFILAHEVGHHINGHSIDILLVGAEVIEPKTLAKKRQQELEADSFAAFVLAKLGASLPQLNSVITLISNNTDDQYSTHPSRSKRLLSVKEGYNKALINNEKLNKRSAETNKIKKPINIDEILEDKSIIKYGSIIGDTDLFEKAPKLSISKKEEISDMWPELTIRLKLYAKPEEWPQDDFGGNNIINVTVFFLDKFNDKIFNDEVTLKYDSESKAYETRWLDDHIELDATVVTKRDNNYKIISKKLLSILDSAEKIALKIDTYTALVDNDKKIDSLNNILNQRKSYKTENFEFVKSYVNWWKSEPNRTEFKRRMYYKEWAEWWSNMEELKTKIGEIRKKNTSKGYYKDDIEKKLERLGGNYNSIKFYGGERFLKKELNSIIRWIDFNIKKIESQIRELKNDIRYIDIDEKFLLVYDLPKQISIYKD